MSFMFKPLAYDDPNAVNHPQLPAGTREKLVCGTTAAGAALAAAALAQMEKSGKGCAVVIDGYAGARFCDLAGALCQTARQRGAKVITRTMEELYLPSGEIDKKVRDNLPLNYEEDPPLLFGRLYEGAFEDFIDPDKAAAAQREMDTLAPGTLYLLTGRGSACGLFQPRADITAYVDVTPKVAAIRARNGQLCNVGDTSPRPFAELMRRNYFVDFEIILQLRRQLLREGKLTYYLCGDDPENFILMPGKTQGQILRALADAPFRCKPVYLEGIWGGEFVRKARKLPKEYKNIAWVFDLIPMEVSIVADVEGQLVEFPYFTMVQQLPEEIMGEKCTREFDGYFPIRFNYDDTYHSNGNMSIQVHPYESYCMEHYNEKGSQDEAYYVVATGHGARTYLGFNEDADPQEFIRLIKQSEKDGSEVDYAKYVSHIDSVPGRQVMIPGGTIHASGRNQLILELGSLTIGSYTYKMYDYNRRDAEGNQRPIHSINGERVLKTERTTSWVRENVAIEPQLLSEGEGYREYLLGQTDLMYYRTSRVELGQGAKAEFPNNGQFTVLTLVDGEEARIYSKSNPSLCYRQKFLDIVVVPATITDYVIENAGYQPCVVHKTLLKPGYRRFQNQ